MSALASIPTRPYYPPHGNISALIISGTNRVFRVVPSLGRKSLNLPSPPERGRWVPIIILSCADVDIAYFCDKSSPEIPSDVVDYVGDLPGIDSWHPSASVRYP